MMNTNYRAGDLVVYRKTKHSTQPVPHASNVQPAQKGETYSYTVDKFWVVDSVLEDGTIVTSSRRGKKTRLKADDPMLRRASLIQRILYRTRFAQLPDSELGDNSGLAAS